MTVPVLDLERQHKAKEYARLRRRMFFADTGLSALILLAWLVLGWAVSLKAWLGAVTQNEWWLVAGFGALFFLSLEILELPLAYYTGLVLPHRYDMSNQTLREWIKDQLLGLALSAAIGLPLLEGVYWLLRVSGPNWWLWAAAGYVGFGVIMSSLAPVLIMPLFNKYLPLGDDHAELTRRLRILAARAGTTVSGVFRFDMSKRTRAANAALTGLGNTRRIILGDTLLNEFTLDEVETVIAHELGHHVHRDIPLGILVSSLFALAGLWLASLALNWGAANLGFSGPADIGALPLFALTLGAFGLVMMPLTNAYSRWRERLADQYALHATRKPEAFASAFIRLANQNLGEADPEGWVVFLFASHPPIRERVEAARRFRVETPTRA